MKYIFALLMLPIFSQTNAIAQSEKEQLASFENERYSKELFINGTDTMPYRLLLPENYDNTKKYPLILFLHGAGERGAENERQLLHGGSLFLVDSIRKKYPAIVVFPQCPESIYWISVGISSDTPASKKIEFDLTGAPNLPMNMAMGITKEIIQHYAVNESQVYVMGLSMGGMGAFEIVNRMPSVFAAAVPICGGSDTSIAQNLRKTAWWIFHGEWDEVVPCRYSQQMIEALYKYYDVEMQFTLYPKVGHNCWDYVFKEPELFWWLFQQKVKN